MHCIGGYKYAKASTCTAPVGASSACVAAKANTCTASVGTSSVYGCQGKLMHCTELCMCVMLNTCHSPIMWKRMKKSWRRMLLLLPMVK